MNTHYQTWSCIISIIFLLFNFLSRKLTFLAVRRLIPGTTALWTFSWPRITCAVRASSASVCAVRTVITIIAHCKIHILKMFTLLSSHKRLDTIFQSSLVQTKYLRTHYSRVQNVKFEIVMIVSINNKSRSIKRAKKN